MPYWRETVFGRMGIEEQDGFLTRIWLPGRGEGEAQAPEPPVVREAFRQLEGYFAGTLTTFDLPLKPKGTPFMLRVWDALCQVPYGATASYKDIAVAVDSPRACRAVGLANNRNPLPIVIPCHRIVGSNGSLVGYAGGLGMKERLLELERSQRDAHGR